MSKITRSTTTALTLAQRVKARVAAFDNGHALTVKTPRSERRLLQCHCAVHDKPFFAVFTRAPGTVSYELAGLKKIVNSHREGSVGAASGTVCDASDFPLHHIICPYCGSINFMMCGRCKSFVCDGRSLRMGAEIMFCCASSCGSSGGVTNRLDTITTTKLARGPARKRIAKPSAQSFLPKPK